MKASVNVFGVPDDTEGVYHIRDWRRVPLFTCTLEIEESAIDEPRLPITLVKNGELIAQSFYRIVQETAVPGRAAPSTYTRAGINAGTSGVFPVGGSTKHFILTVEKGKLRALVGIAFIDRNDAIDFTYLLHEFARPREELPIPKGERKTWDVADLNASANAYKASYNTGEAAPTLVGPPAESTINPGDLSDSDSDFGDFQ